MIKKILGVMVLIFCVFLVFYVFQNKRIHKAEGLRYEKCMNDCTERAKQTQEKPNCFCNRIFIPNLDEILFYRDGDI